MRIDWIILCRYVENAGHPGMATIVGAGADTIKVRGLPAKAALTFAVRICGTEAELNSGQPHDLTARFLDPDLNELSKIDGKFGGNVKMPGGHEVGMIMPMKAIVEVKKAGCYTIEIAVDGQGHSVPFFVST